MPLLVLKKRSVAMFKLFVLALVLQHAACKGDSPSREDSDAGQGEEDAAPPTDVLARDVAVADVAAPDARKDGKVVDSRLPVVELDAEEEGDGGLSEGYNPTGFLPDNKPNSFVQVGIGASHGCGLRADGAVRCWGANNYGQSEPPAGQFSKVAAGGGWSCGLKAGTNELVCWGVYAKAMAPIGEFARLELGGTLSAPFACGLRPNGRVVCWGNMQGESPPSGGYTELALGMQGACGIKKTDRSVFCWGQSYFVQEETPRGEFLQVTVGAGYACALKADTSLACWGRTETGSTVTTPAGKGFSEISAGPRHTCAIRDKSVVCWGSKDDGRSDPPAGDFVRVKAGPRHTCGIKTDGQLRCWGQIKFPIDDYTTISARRFGGVCGVRPDATASCWGELEGGPLPPGTFKEMAFSIPDCGILTDGTLTCWNQIGGGVLSEPIEGTFKKVSTFLADGCAIRTDGTLKCWSRVSNDRIQPPSGVFVDVSVAKHRNGSADICAVRQSGGITCWGEPARLLYQLPTPPGVFEQVTVSSSGGACALAVGGEVKCWAGAPAPPDKAMLRVSAAASYFCGIATSGEAVCWSGVGGVTPSGDRPPADIKFKQIDSSDADYTCGLDIENRVWCWGTLVLRPLDR